MRVLLPAEIELCQAVGLTEQEYWDFVRLNEAYNGKRSEAYAHIPDVRNDPVTAIVVNLVIGIALTAVASLLAPKPRAPEERAKPQLETGDQTSQSKYAPQSNFDSLQQLAALGSVIPLIYCKYNETSNKGGVRVNSTLLWSYMISLGRGTQLRALALFSNGAIKTKPDFAGYAIGDLLLNNYAQGKVALYFRVNGGRMNEGNGYVESLMEEPYEGASDSFAIKWGGAFLPYFSGARTPGTQAVFGNYLAMPNGNRFKVNYELLLKIDGIDGDVEDDIRARQRKIRDWFPRYCYVYGPGNANDKSVAVGDEVRYVIDGFAFTSKDYGGSNAVIEINQALNNARVAIDGALVVGETYLIGTALAVCVNKNGSPWSPGRQVTAVFKITTAGIIDTRDTDRKDKPDNLTIQRVAIATISNNRACNRTDLIIKSTVWRKITGFTNVNSQPSQSTIERYEDEDGSITLGQMNIYNKRQSFFGLEYRLQGTDTWTNITPENTGFVVEGRTPEAVYNQIFIRHPNTNAYDFRLTPIPGNAVGRFWGIFGREVNLYFLDAAGAYDNTYKQPAQNSFTKNGFTVSYTGFRKLFYRDEGSNKEWEIYKVPNGEAYDLYGDINVGGSDGRTVNLRYGDAYQDYTVYEAEELSNATAPEHEVVSVNEILQSYPYQVTKYTNLAYSGIRLNSGAEWTSFSELSAYFKDGLLVPKLLGSSTGSVLDSTNLLPEIAYDLLTNILFGVGEAVGATQVNVDEMTVAANFCKGNNFFWDGVIAERVNIREWIYEQAGYCLLQFRIKGGQFSLYPDVPFDSNGTIAPDAPISASAIFTDGTMSGLKVSFLSPEERQLFKAAVLWRQDVINGFPQTRTVTVKLAASPDSVPEETFDMSGFCTSEEHAVTFAKYALKVRELVDHGITFQTTPQLAMQLEPGQYFQVATAVAHPRSTGRSADRFKNGSISPDGTITGLKLKDGAYQIQYWTPGTEGLRETTIDVKEGSVADVSLRGSVFAVATQNGTQTRMYKVESLTYAEDGLVEIAGSFTPLIENRLAVLDWDGQFEVFSS